MCFITLKQRNVPPSGKNVKNHEMARGSTRTRPSGPKLHVETYIMMIGLTIRELCANVRFITLKLRNVS